MLNSFWWGDGSNNKGIWWLAWDRLARPKDEGGLGYRNFHVFNKSLIAKQAWKFVTEPDKLVSRIFKARYFPRASIFNAKLGDNPSYVWRSIWKSRDILVNGCRWKIGDGRNIKIMQDPWLRGEESVWVSSPQNQSVYNLCVSDLLLQGVKRWDGHKICSLFPESVATSIMSTPLLEEVTDDKMVWQHENHGKYTVKSGYNHYIKKESVTKNIRVEGDWSSLWRVNAPPKAKHLLWRICRGCLPTRARLKERYVPCPSECPLCVNNEEDDWHILFGCRESRQVWNDAGLWEVMEPRLHNINSVGNVLFDICRNESSITAGNVAMVVWCIWHNRNSWVWNEVKVTAKEVAMRAVHMVGEWRAVNTAKHYNTLTADMSANYKSASAELSVQQPSNVTTLLRWQKPRYGWWKCKVDASLSQNPIVTGWGWCVRNSDGVFIAAGTNTCMYNYTAAEGEALALLEAMRVAVFKGWTNIVFESDSKVLVDAIQANHQGISEWSSIISSIKLLLQCNTNFEVKFTKRQANMAAHTLCRAAISWSSCTYFNSVPRCIEPLIINEMC